MMAHPIPSAGAASAGGRFSLALTSWKIRGFYSSPPIRGIYASFLCTNSNKSHHRRTTTRRFPPAAPAHRHVLLWNQLHDDDGMPSDQQARGQGSTKDDSNTSSSRMKPMVESLLESAISRSMSTLAGSKRTSDPSESFTRAATTTTTQQKIDTNNNNNTGSSHNNKDDKYYNEKNNTPPNQHEDKRTYISNPAVTATAMAHSIWSQVVRPYDDIVIDATAGNGKDTLVLAQMLFPPPSSSSSFLSKQESETKIEDEKCSPSPRLISIDIQKRACENTMELLRYNLTPHAETLLEKYITVLNTSHAPMPSLPKESVGLVCYNLGYLPGADKEEFNTQMETTIQSLADSALLIRPGGLLSVMSYPGNGWKEHCAVAYFMEGLAMFTSKSMGGWRGYVNAIPCDYDLEQCHNGLHASGECTLGQSLEEASIRETVRLALERVHAMGFDKQTWRVFDHRPLGRPLSPILFTGMRIK